MSSDIVQLSASDFQDAMDFLNLVFGAHRPHDFERLLPAVYRPTDEAMACNFAIREDGRIRAIVGMYPRRWRVGRETLSVAGIGGVSTHPKSRGAGYMKRLMNHCVETMRAQGYHLSHLGGQRQRYRYFGYEHCGHVLQFSCTRSNLRHCYGGDDPGIRFEPLSDPSAPTERLETARKLHDAQPAHCLRPRELFGEYLRNWNHLAHAALDAQNRMVGYVVTDEEGRQIAELVAADDSIFDRVLRAWVAARGSALIEVSPSFHPLRTRHLGTWCESVTPHRTGAWQVFDWPRVLSVLLRARRALGPLEDGEVRVHIQGLGNLALTVDGDHTACTWTAKEPHMACDAQTAMRVFFGPTRPCEVMPVPGAARPLDQWCPLPLHWPRQDSV